MRNSNRKFLTLIGQRIFACRLSKRGQRGQNELRLHVHREMSLDHSPVPFEASEKPFDSPKRPAHPRCSRNRVEIDAMKVARRGYQCTAIDKFLAFVDLRLAQFPSRS